MFARTIVQNRTQGYAIIVGELAQNERHSHFSVHYILGLEGTVEVHTDDTVFTGQQGVATRPWASHRLVGTQHAPALIISASPLSGIGQSIVARLDGRAAAILNSDPSEIRRAALALHHTSGAFDDAANALVAAIDELVVNGKSLAGTGAAIRRPVAGISSGHTPEVETPPLPGSQLDPRIQQALMHIATHTEGFLAAGLAAERIGLSESRFLHLFSEQIGMSYRKMQRWIRLASAFESVCTRRSLTGTAHEFGFSDSAHFSRSFHEAFGMAPSLLVQNSRFVQVPSSVTP